MPKCEQKVLGGGDLTKTMLQHYSGCFLSRCTHIRVHMSGQDRCSGGHWTILSWWQLPCPRGLWMVTTFGPNTCGALWTGGPSLTLHKVSHLPLNSKGRAQLTESRWNLLISWWGHLQGWSPSSTYQQLLTLWWVPRTNVPLTNIHLGSCLPGQLSPWHLYPDKCRCTNKTYYTLHTVSQRAKTKHEIPGMFQSRLGKRVSMLVTHYLVPDYFFVGNFTKNPPNSRDTSL